MQEGIKEINDNGKNTVKTIIKNFTIYFGLLAQRRQKCNFLWSSPIQVHPTPATSTMLPKFNPNEIKVIDLRGTSEEVGAHLS